MGSQFSLLHSTDQSYPVHSALALGNRLRIYIGTDKAKPAPPFAANKPAVPWKITRQASYTPFDAAATTSPNSTTVSAIPSLAKPAIHLESSTNWISPIIP